MNTYQNGIKTTKHYNGCLRTIEQCDEVFALLSQSVVPHVLRANGLELQAARLANVSGEFRHCWMEMSHVIRQVCDLLEIDIDGCAKEEGSEREKAHHISNCLNDLHYALMFINDAKSFDENENPMHYVRLASEYIRSCLHHALRLIQISQPENEKNALNLHRLQQLVPSVSQLGVRHGEMRWNS